MLKKYIAIVSLILIVSATSAQNFYKNKIFTEDLFVKDFSHNRINLKDIEISKDTVLVFVWCKTCGSCIHYLNWFKSKGKEKNYQIIAIAITKNDSIDREKAFMEKFKWPFQIYYDKNQSVAKYFVNRYFKESNQNRKEVGFYGFPRIFMFVKNEYFCSSCDKFVNPYYHRAVK